MDPEVLAEYQKKFPEVFAVIEGVLERFPELDKLLKSQGLVKDQIDAQAKQVLETVAKDMKPYREQYETFRELPKEGRPKEQVLKELREMQAAEIKKWKEGYVSEVMFQAPFTTAMTATLNTSIRRTQSIRSRTLCTPTSGRAPASSRQKSFRWQGACSLKARVSLSAQSSVVR